MVVGAGNPIFYCITFVFFGLVLHCYRNVFMHGKGSTFMVYMRTNTRKDWYVWNSILKFMFGTFSQRNIFVDIFFIEIFLDFYIILYAIFRNVFILP